MNNNLSNESITQAITKLEEAINLLRIVIEGIQTTEREIYEITKYQASSGNITWRGECEDGVRVYFRQSQKPMYEDLGCWDWLNQLDIDVSTPVSIIIETIPDSDFFKIVNVKVWYLIDFEGKSI